MKYQTFEATALLAIGESPIDVVECTGRMVVCTDDYPVLITKAQAMAFFGLVEPTTSPS